TQCPSLRSIAGMISMGWITLASGGTSDSRPLRPLRQTRGILTGYKGLGARRGNGASLPGRTACSVPGDEIRQQAQAGRLAFFRVELHSENVIPRGGARKAERITGGARHQSLFRRLHVVAVHKIEAAAIGNAR